MAYKEPEVKGKEAEIKLHESEAKLKGCELHLKGKKPEEEMRKDIIREE